MYTKNNKINIHNLVLIKLVYINKYYEYNLINTNIN